MQGALRPDLTLLLDVPLEVGLQRAASRGEGKDRFEAERAEFFQAVRRCYQDRAAAEPRRFRVIDAARDREAVATAIRAALDGGLGATP